MASPPSTPSPPSDAFCREFLRQADVRSQMRFDAFVDLALYHPFVGYYRANRTRVGRGAETDFYTSASSGPYYGELVAAACVSLMGDDDPKYFTFIEIGAEPGTSVLDGVPSPFYAHRTLRVGDLLSLEGKCVVFSNELFDAQPFRRFRAKGGQWIELGVELRDHGLAEIELAPVAESWLPPVIEDGFHFDAPRRANELLEAIVHQPWSGLFVAADYGKSFRELSEAAPAGTARAYSKHTQSNDLLAHPGEQDLTCHVCWDWLEAELVRYRFTNPTVVTQESFFVHHAGGTIASLLASEATLRSDRKRALMQLLHPGNLGQKFQVLHARRA